MINTKNSSLALHTITLHSSRQITSPSSHPLHGPLHITVQTVTLEWLSWMQLKLSYILTTSKLPENNYSPTSKTSIVMLAWYDRDGISHSFFITYPAWEFLYFESFSSRFIAALYLFSEQLHYGPAGQTLSTSLSPFAVVIIILVNACIRSARYIFHSDTVRLHAGGPQISALVNQVNMAWK